MEDTVERQEKSNEELKSAGKTIIRTQIFAAIVAAWVHISAEINFSYTGVFLPDMTNPNSTDIILNAEQASLFSSIIHLGNIVGAVANGLLNAWLGQRVTLLLLIPIGVVGWIILALSSAFGLLILSRVITGCLASAVITSANNYIVEISHPSIRGRLLALTDIVRPSGLFFLAILSALGLNWRTAGLVAGLTTFIPPFIFLLFLPDSPRWLATMNRRQKAKASLNYFRGSSYDTEKEVNEIFDQVRGTNNISTLGQLKAIGNKDNIGIFMTLFVLMALNPFAGLVAVLTYMTTIFESANPEADPNFSVIIASITRVLGAILYLFIADKFRRKYIYVGPVLFSGLSMAMLALYFFLIDKTDMSNISWMPLASMTGYLFSTYIYYPVLMLIRSELLPTSIRAIASNILYIIMSVGLFTIAYVYPYMVEAMGPVWTHLFFAIMCVIVGVYVMVFIPETQGKTLEQIAKKE